MRQQANLFGSNIPVSDGSTTIDVNLKPLGANIGYVGALS